MIYASPPVLSTPDRMRDRALTVLVRGFDASLIGEDELLQHMAKVGTVERVKIVVKEGDGRDHAFVDYFNEKLPRDRDSFQQLIAEYIEAAEYCRRKKLTPKRGGSVGEPSTLFPPKRVPSCGAHDSLSRRLP